MMASLWFTYGSAHRDEGACFCDHCFFAWNCHEKDLQPYVDGGLDLSHGATITLALVKHATQIMMDHLQYIHQPMSLERLCGRVIWDHATGVFSQLPLPSIMQDWLRGDEYWEDIGGNFAVDPKFKDFAKHLPGLLWSHLGYKVIRNRPHPINY